MLAGEENKVYLLTKNPGKLLAAKNAFSKHKIVIGQLAKSYPEIQASTSAEIAKNAAEKAAEEHKVTVVREDHSIYKCIRHSWTLCKLFCEKDIS